MKRFFAYFLALAMALSLLAGCGNKDVVPAETAVAQGQETTGAAGGGTPQKSFSFKHRAKRANSKGTYKVVQRSDRRGSARLRAAEQSMQSKGYSVRL